MDELLFLYRDASGTEKAWRVLHWKESGKYIQGIAAHDNKFRTFRKDRVVEYLDSSDLALLEPHPAPPPKVSQSPDVLFTGFSKARRAELEAFAADHGLAVRKTVTKNLVFLCCGGNAGPKKVEAAREQGCYVLLEESFLAMLATGELPD